MSALYQKKLETNQVGTGGNTSTAHDVNDSGGGNLRDELRSSNYEDGRRLTSPNTTNEESEEPSTESGQQEAVADLGDIDSFGDGFYAAAGGVLESLLPNEGDEGKAQINVNLPVGGNGSVKIGFEFSINGERLSGGGLKSRCEAKVNVSAELDLRLVKAFAQAGLSGYLEAQGDSGDEVFRLFSLALQQRVENVSEWAADKVWGKGYEKETVANMDSDDYAQSGMGLEFSAGVGSAKALGDADLEAGVAVSAGTRLTAKDGKLRETSVKTFEVTASVDIDGWKGEVTGTFSKSGRSKGEIEFVGTRKASLFGSPDLFDADAVREMLIHWATGIAGAITSRITTDDTNSSTAAKVGAIATAIGQISGGDSLVLGSAGVEALKALSVSTLSSVGFEQSLTVGGGWEGYDGYANVSFDRRSKIELGEDERDLIYVLLENTQQVLSWETTFAVGKAPSPEQTKAALGTIGATLGSILGLPVPQTEAGQSTETKQAQNKPEAKEPAAGYTRASFLQSLMKSAGVAGMLASLIEKAGMTTALSPEQVMDAAAARGLVAQGGAAGRPNDPITRAEAAVILSRYLNCAAGSLPGPVRYFDDVGQSDWFFWGAHACRYFGVFRGTNENWFLPNGIVDASVGQLLIDRAKSPSPQSVVQQTEGMKEAPLADPASQSHALRERTLQAAMGHLGAPYSWGANGRAPSTAPGSRSTSCATTWA